MSAATMCALSLASQPAVAQVTSDLNNFNMTGTTNWWPAAFHTTTSAQARFRWLDDPDYATQIEMVLCTDGFHKGWVTYGAHDTAYQNIGGTPSVGDCFRTTGRLYYAWGPSLLNHDGRVMR